MSEGTTTTPWLESIVALRLSSFRRNEDGSPAALSAGGLSSVYIGRLRLASGRPRRVAIKRFRRPPDDTEAVGLQGCIEALVRARVRLPKTTMARLPDGEWVQVSQLFGSWRRGSKLSQASLFYRKLPHAARVEAVRDLARVANAGYRPVLDLFLTLGVEPPSALPLDLDLVVREHDAAQRVFHLLRCTMQLGDDAAERRLLLTTAREECQGDVAAALEKRLGDPDDPFRPYWRDDGARHGA